LIVVPRRTELTCEQRLGTNHYWQNDFQVFYEIGGPLSSISVNLILSAGEIFHGEDP